MSTVVVKNHDRSPGHSPHSIASPFSPPPRSRRVRRAMARLWQRHKAPLDHFCRPWSDDKPERKPETKRSPKSLLFSMGLAYEALASLNFFIPREGYHQPCSTRHASWDTRYRRPPTSDSDLDDIEYHIEKHGLAQALYDSLDPSQQSYSVPVTLILQTCHWVGDKVMEESHYTADALVSIYEKTSVHPETESLAGDSLLEADPIHDLSTSQQHHEQRCDHDRDELSAGPVGDDFQVCQVHDGTDISSSELTASKNGEHLSITEGVGAQSPAQTAGSDVYYPVTWIKEGEYGNMMKGHENDPAERKRNQTNKDEAISSGQRHRGTSTRDEQNGTSRKSSPNQKRESPEQNRASGAVATSGQKRPLALARRHEEDDKDDDSGGEDGEPPAPKRQQKEDPDAKKFACPFYKHNPQEFKEFRTCMGPGWTSIHRIKEHIFRRHKLPEHQCQRCYEDFGNKTLLHDHQRANPPCQTKEPPKMKGINEKQEKALKSRKMYQKSLTEEEKWTEIYKILFPDDAPIPSPYYEPELPDYYRSWLMRQLPGLVSKQLSDNRSELALDPEALRQIEGAVQHALRDSLPGMHGFGEKKGNSSSKALQAAGALPQQSEPSPKTRTLLEAGYSDVKNTNGKQAIAYRTRKEVTSGPRKLRPIEPAESAATKIPQNSAQSRGPWQTNGSQIKSEFQVTGQASEAPEPKSSTSPPMIEPASVESAAFETNPMEFLWPGGNETNYGLAAFQIDQFASMPSTQPRHLSLPESNLITSSLEPWNLDEGTLNQLQTSVSEPYQFGFMPATGTANFFGHSEMTSPEAISATPGDFNLFECLDPERADSGYESNFMKHTQGGIICLGIVTGDWFNECYQDAYEELRYEPLWKFLGP
ncbi:hypothetical protein NM208_g1212 [Fusarium decemcellulare]|uniref:Uncharacterized protein n=1 Tax=Fusarium decemcellulare TaxID=57161 RepID=A0ACC1SX33_9HYPO|nr:hypothetical protein NM208_g1212 [Fusarium decemcellulare]